MLKEGIDCSKGYYLLDPDNNLPRTQTKLKDTLEQSGWEGVVGRRPSHDELKEVLQSSDLFMQVS